jgi:cell division protein FtsB
MRKHEDNVEELEQRVSDLQDEIDRIKKEAIEKSAQEQAMIGQLAIKRIDSDYPVDF